MLPSLIPVLLKRRPSITDNFDRQDGALGGRSDGGLWVPISGTFVIASGQAQCSVANAEVGASLRSDLTISCDITTDYTNFPQIRFRGDGTTNNALGCYIDSSGALQLFQVIAGTPTGITAGAGSAGDFPSGSKATLSVVLSGSNITAMVGGVTKVATTSTQWQTQTWVGFHAESNQALFDNFSAN